MDEHVKLQFSKLFEKQDEMKPIIERFQFESRTHKINPIIKDDLPKSGVLLESNDDPDDYYNNNEDTNIISSFEESCDLFGEFD
jgi:hypothetical protein